MTERTNLPGLLASGGSDRPVGVGRPGVPLPSGFEPEHGGRRRNVRLSPEARQRVLDKMRSVDEARRRAMEDGHGFVIG